MNRPIPHNYPRNIQTAWRHENREPPSARQRQTSAVPIKPLLRRQRRTRSRQKLRKWRLEGLVRVPPPVPPPRSNAVEAMRFNAIPLPSFHMGRLLKSIWAASEYRLWEKFKVPRLENTAKAWAKERVKAQGALVKGHVCRRMPYLPCPFGARFHTHFHKTNKPRTNNITNHHYSRGKCLEIKTPFRVVMRRPHLTGSSGGRCLTFGSAFMDNSTTFRRCHVKTDESKGKN